nr:hypothetical protein CTI12_AA260590 [Tanacetum cinerariifolium]
MKKTQINVIDDSSDADLELSQKSKNHEFEQLFDHEAEYDSQDAYVTHPNDIEDDVTDDYDLSDSFINDGLISDDSTDKSQSIFIKENHHPQDNCAKPNDVFSTPSVRRSLGNVQLHNNNSKRTRTPTQLSPLSKQKASVVHYDVSHISLTPQTRGHPRLLDISTCKVKDATYTPSDALVTSLGYVLHPNNNSSKSIITPTQISSVSNKLVTFVNSDVGHISLTRRPRGWPCPPDISTCKPKDATATPADETLRSVLNVLPNNNNSLKRTRTPMQVSSISNQTSTVLDSGVGNISLTPRPKGRQCMHGISSCQSKNATSRPGAQSPRISLTPRPIGRSVTFISTIYNGKNLGEISGHTATKESPSTGQVRVSSVQSSLLTSNSPKHKRQMITRQHARRINFSEAVQKVDKKDKGHKFAKSMRGATNASSDSYSLCYGRGKVELTNEVPEPPQLLKELITNKHPKSASFIDNIRQYNSMFAFTSMGDKQDTSVNTGRGPYCYRLHGKNYHLVEPLLPKTGKPAKFAQLYIIDTENEIQNRISAVSNGESSSSKNDQLDYKLTTDIRDLLDEINPLVKDFRMAGERIRSSDDKKSVLGLLEQEARW